MRGLLAVCVAVAVSVPAAPAAAEKVSDFTGLFTDAEGNKGYIEVLAEDGAVLRACNENGAIPLVGDSGTGYIWVNPSGEASEPTYGNEIVGNGDADGSDDEEPQDGDGETDDDCAGNTD